MKIVHFTFRRFFSCFSFFITFIKKILFRGRQRKSSQGDKDSIPTSVTVSRDQVSFILSCLHDLVSFVLILYSWMQMELNGLASLMDIAIDTIQIINITKDIQHCRGFDFVTSTMQILVQVFLELIELSINLIEPRILE